MAGVNGGCVLVSTCVQCVILPWTRINQLGLVCSSHELAQNRSVSNVSNVSNVKYKFVLYAGETEPVLHTSHNIKRYFTLDTLDTLDTNTISVCNGLEVYYPRRYVRVQGRMPHWTLWVPACLCWKNTDGKYVFIRK